MGIDEAGCGPWAGPVVASCVYFNNTHDLPLNLINDSKKLSASKRFKIYNILINHPHVNFGIGCANVIEIDKLNILRANHLAMNRALKSLIGSSNLNFKRALIDGIHRPTLIEVAEVETITKGDSKFYNIAAASIIAKVWRDLLMLSLHQTYRHYNWHLNAGYGTAFHKLAIDENGITPHHRTSFKPIKLFVNQEV